jgi:hypothetical protein
MRSTILAALAACGGATATPPPYAAAGKLAAPRLFAPGAVSTELPEFAITFAPDGKTAYFDRATADRSSFAIVASSFANGAWQPARPLPFSTGEFRDVDPFAAGDRLYFSSNRPPAADFDTWYVTRRGDGWSDPVHLDGAPSGAGNQVFVSIARDGTMYFQADANGGDLFRAPRTGDAYPTAAPLDAINTPASESNPAISPDGTLLVFASERPGGSGGADLHASRFRDGAWTPARNLGAVVNSPQADFAPSFSPDGRYLFFTSERPGVLPAPASGRPPGDIYQIDVESLGI